MKTISTIATTAAHHVLPGDTIIMNERTYVISECGPDTFTIREQTRWDRLKAWAYRVWPFRFRGFWRRVWAR